MNLEPVTLVTVFLELEETGRRKVGRLATRDRRILFEYDPAFLRSGLELSARHLPLRSGVLEGDPKIFDGLMGLFDDSLPDGWGRLLMDRAAAKAGIPRSALTPLDRLTLVGTRGMGALVYEPEVGVDPPSVVRLREVERDARALLKGGTAHDLNRLIALGGSPQGARPKVLVQLSADEQVIVGDPAPRPGFEPYLVKFRAQTDDRHSGTLEHAYLLMAAEAGIDVPPSRLLGRTKTHPGYFAVKRFDRGPRGKLHLHTLAGYLHAPPALSSVTYADLLLTTRELTRNEADVAEMFRRACFNVFAHNRDDHARNFAFLMDARGEWKVSPAFDLTFSEGPGGEHTLLVDTEGANPTREHLLRLARTADLKRAAAIVDDVEAAVQRFHHFAESAGLPAKPTHAVAQRLGVGGPPRGRSGRRDP